MVLTNVPSVAKAIFPTFLCLCFYYIYVIKEFYRDPGSIFFDPDRAFDRSYSRHREIEANSFRDEAFFAWSTNQSNGIPLWKPSHRRLFARLS